MQLSTVSDGSAVTLHGKTESNAYDLSSKSRVWCIDPKCHPSLQTCSAHPLAPLANSFAWFEILGRAISKNRLSKPALYGAASRLPESIRKSKRSADTIGCCQLFPRDLPDELLYAKWKILHGQFNRHKVAILLRCGSVAMFAGG